MGIHFLIFGITCAATITALNYTFQLIFAIESTTIALSNLKNYKSVAGVTNYFLIAMLTLEIFSQYSLALKFGLDPSVITKSQ